jgi:hypothetical protein
MRTVGDLRQPIRFARDQHGLLHNAARRVVELDAKVALSIELTEREP